MNHEYIAIFDNCACSREIIDIFLYLKKNFHIGFFLDTVKARSLKLCMIVTLLGAYIVILGMITLTLIQGYRCVRNINHKLHVLYSCLL